MTLCIFIFLLCRCPPRSQDNFMLKRQRDEAARATKGREGRGQGRQKLRERLQEDSARPLTVQRPYKFSTIDIKAFSNVPTAEDFRQRILLKSMLGKVSRGQLSWARKSTVKRQSDKRDFTFVLDLCWTWDNLSGDQNKKITNCISCRSEESFRNLFLYLVTSINMPLPCPKESTNTTQVQIGWEYRVPLIPATLCRPSSFSRAI